MPSVKLVVTITVPSSPTQISAAVMVKVDTSGKALIAKSSLALTALDGEQPLPSVTFVTVTVCVAVAVVNSAAGMVKVPLPPLMATLAVSPVAAFGADKS